MAGTVTSVPNRRTRIYDNVYFAFFLTHIPVMFCKLISPFRCRLDNQSIAYSHVDTRTRLISFSLRRSRGACSGLTLDLQGRITETLSAAVIDLQPLILPLLPFSPPEVFIRPRQWYMSTYADKFFDEPPAWFMAFIVMEAVYHVPLSFWAVSVLRRGEFHRECSYIPGIGDDGSEPHILIFCREGTSPSVDASPNICGSDVHHYVGMYR